jgi:tetratricopeptide (TPR) repeat protein
LAKGSDRHGRRAAILALTLLGEYDSNPVVAAALLDTDRLVRLIAEEGIGQLWQRGGTAPQRSALQSIIDLNGQQRHQQAATDASELIEQAPTFAELWNQRSLAHYHLRLYSDSIRDSCHALEINPYYFGCAVRMGRCHVKLDDPISALECFRLALRLNPNLEGVRAKVIYLQKSLRDMKGHEPLRKCRRLAESADKAALLDTYSGSLVTSRTPRYAVFSILEMFPSLQCFSKPTKIRLLEPDKMSG